MLWSNCKFICHYNKKCRDISGSLYPVSLKGNILQIFSTKELFMNRLLWWVEIKSIYKHIVVLPQGKSSESLSVTGVWKAELKRHEISPVSWHLKERVKQACGRFCTPDYWKICRQNLTLFSTQPQTSPIFGLRCSHSPLSAKGKKKWMAYSSREGNIMFMVLLYKIAIIWQKVMRYGKMQINVNGNQEKKRL